MVCSQINQDTADIDQVLESAFLEPIWALVLPSEENLLSSSSLPLILLFLLLVPFYMPMLNTLCCVFFNDLCVLCDEGDDADSSVCTGRVPEAFTTRVNNPNKRLELVTIVWSFFFFFLWPHLFHKLILILFLFLFALLCSWKHLLRVSSRLFYYFIFLYLVLNNKLHRLLLACDPSGAQEETPGVQSQSKAEIDGGEKNETLGSINHHGESEVFGK